MEANRFRALELHIPADTRYLSLVRRGVRNLAESMGFPREDVADVELAVSEAVTNSVEHGSTPAGEPAVVVKCRAWDDWLVVEVEDESPAPSLPTDRVPSPLHDERGRGILMMRALMDECQDSRTEHGMRVRMAKQKAVAGSA
jgi:serine/threonine-protein kinase RsbW